MRTCIYLVPIDYDSIIKKGVSLQSLYDRDLNGFFDKVYHIHFVAENDKEIVLNDNHTIIEYGLKSKSIISKFIHFIKVYRNLKKRFQNKKIDIIVASEPVVSSFFAYLLSKTLNSKWIIKIVSNYDLTYKMTGQMIYPFLKFKFLEDLVTKYFFKRANSVLCLSNDNRYYAISKGAKEENSYIMRGMGCDLEFNETFTESQIDSKLISYKNMHFILFVGRLSAEKYPEDFCKIADKLANLNIKFLLAGDGPLKSILENKYSHLNNLKFLGFVNQDEIKYLNGYAYFVFAPLSGCSLIESGKMKANILTYNIEWHSEVIIDNYSGKVFNFRDWKLVAQYIKEVYNKNINVNIFGENLSRIINSLFNRNELIEKEKNVYLNLLERKKNGK